MSCAMVGSSFTILSETPCADPHAGCCGGWRLDTSGYPIRWQFIHHDRYEYHLETAYRYLSLLLPSGSARKRPILYYNAP
jgi:hypothetical protein